MLNQYKIDVNRFFDIRHPYALYVRRPTMWWFGRWEQVGSFSTVEEATVAYRLLADMPIHLTITSRSTNMLTVDPVE
jgi:hypothetical protein